MSEQTGVTAPDHGPLEPYLRERFGDALIDELMESYTDPGYRYVLVRHGYAEACMRCHAMVADADEHSSWHRSLTLSTKITQRILLNLAEAAGMAVEP